MWHDDEVAAAAEAQEGLAEQVKHRTDAYAMYSDTTDILTETSRGVTSSDLGASMRAYRWLISHDAGRLKAFTFRPDLSDEDKAKYVKTFCRLGQAHLKAKAKAKAKAEAKAKAKEDAGAHAGAGSAPKPWPEGFEAAVLRIVHSQRVQNSSTLLRAATTKRAVIGDELKDESHALDLDKELDQLDGFNFRHVQNVFLNVSESITPLKRPGPRSNLGFAKLDAAESEFLQDYLKDLPSKTATTKKSTEDKWSLYYMAPRAILLYRLVQKHLFETGVLAEQSTSTLHLVYDNAKTGKNAMGRVLKPGFLVMPTTRHSPSLRGSQATFDSKSGKPQVEAADSWGQLNEYATVGVAALPIGSVYYAVLFSPHGMRVLRYSRDGVDKVSVKVSPFVSVTAKRLARLFATIMLGSPVKYVDNYVVGRELVVKTSTTVNAVYPSRTLLRAEGDDEEEDDGEETKSEDEDEDEVVEVEDEEEDDGEETKGEDEDEVEVEDEDEPARDLKYAAKIVTNGTAFCHEVEIYIRLKRVLKIADDVSSGDHDLVANDKPDHDSDAYPLLHFVDFAQNVMVLSPRGTTISVVSDSVAEMMLQCLESVHQHGVVHGDVRLPNFVVESREPLKVRIIDFGRSFVTEEGPSESDDLCPIPIPPLDDVSEYDFRHDLLAFAILVLSARAHDEASSHDEMVERAIRHSAFGAVEGALAGLAAKTPPTATDYKNVALALRIV